MPLWLQLWPNINLLLQQAPHIDFKVQFSSVGFGSVRFGSVRFGWVRLGWVRLGWVRFGSVRFGWVGLGLVWFLVFGFWVLGFGFWVLGFGFWVLGLVWFGLVWFGLVWFGLVWFEQFEQQTHLSLEHVIHNFTLTKSIWVTCTHLNPQAHYKHCMKILKNAM